MSKPWNDLDSRRTLPCVDYRKRPLYSHRSHDVHRYAPAAFVSRPGDYFTPRCFGERAWSSTTMPRKSVRSTISGRHRGSRLVATTRPLARTPSSAPSMAGIISMARQGPAKPRAMPHRQTHRPGPVESEIWNGLDLHPLSPGPQPSVAKLMAPYAKESRHTGWTISCHQRILGNRLASHWKSVRDVDNEVIMSRWRIPALQDFMARLPR